MPDPSPRPFRIEPISLADGEMEAINSRREAEGLRPFPNISPDDEMFADLHSLPEALLQDILAHPDERVALALPPGWGHDVYRKRGKALVADGLLWNPFLDRAHDGTTSSLYGPGAASAAALGPWVKAQTSPRAVEELFRFESEFVHEVAAAHAPVVDKQFIAAAVAAGAGSALLKNHAVTPVDKAQVLAAAMEQGRRLPQRILDIVGRPSIPLTPELVTAIVAHGAPLFAEGALTHDRLSDAFISSADLHRLWKAFPEDGGVVRAVLAHPSSNATIWEDIARSTGAADARDALCSHSEVLQNPEVRKNLRKSSSAKTLAALVVDAKGGELSSLLRKILKKDHDLLLKIVGRAKHLDSIDAVPLVREAWRRLAEENEVRAMSALTWCTPEILAELDREAEAHALFAEVAAKAADGNSLLSHATESMAPEWRATLPRSAWEPILEGGELGDEILALQLVGAMDDPTVCRRAMERTVPHLCVDVIAGRPLGLTERAVIDISDEESFRVTFRRAVTAGEELRLLDGLESNPRLPLHALDPKDLAPVLTSEDRGVRMRAALLVAQIRTSASAHDEPARSSDQAEHEPPRAVGRRHRCSP